MISMMNNDCRFGRRSDTLEDSIGNDRVSEVGVDNANDKFPNPQVVDEVRNSSLELGSGAPDSEVDTRSSGNVKSEGATVSSWGEFSVRVCSASDGGRAENDMGLTGFAVNCETSTIDCSDNPKIRFGAQNEQFQEHDRQEHMSGKQANVEKYTGFENKSLLSEFDDYVAAQRSGGVRAGVSRDLGDGFEVGDMVWGRVKSHPWWPGHIFNEAFASPLVRRTKREGHVLVAFFGDSSYGWFEPDELVPFDPNFAEKSRQTNSRNFLKAVEEAVDEASRRRGLGLACRCRNPDNFRLTNIQGYFSVDVPDYEPGGVYSNSQIRNARDSFRPTDTIDFVKQLALAPNGGEQKSMSFIKNKATVFAYRRAVFEQYDETYAQAFGVPSLSLSHSQVNPLNQPLRQPPMAPLSGPLVIAEALGGGKNSMKVKKDRYLFKRRDETGNSVQSAYKEEASDAAGRYLLQKRAPTVSVATQISDKQDTGLISSVGAASTSHAFVKEAMIDQDQPNGSIIASQGINPDAKPSLEKGKDAFQEMAESFEKDGILNKSMSVSGISWEKTVPIFGAETAQPCDRAGETSFHIKPGKNVKLSRPIEGFHQSEKEFSTAAEASNDVHQVKDNYTVMYASPVEAKHQKTSVDGVVKKKVKRSAGDLNSESSAIGEKKKKKKKKEFDSQMTPERLEKHSASGEVRAIPGKATGKGVSIGLAHREDFSGEQVQVDVSASNMLPVDGAAEVYPELPQLFGDLLALALDRFHGVERKAPLIVRKFFLRFRSHVYQKSLVLSPPTDNESLEVRVTRPSTSVGASDNLPVNHVRPSSVVKPVKRIVRPDDPTKAGRKRAPSDRQEEIAAKRLKKIKDLKAMTAEKKVASQKTSEARRGEGKEPTVPAPPKLAKPDLIRRVEPPAKVVERTILVIKFPPKTSLPSLAELKARFARFGPIDQSGLRVFWKTSTCRVVFLHKPDAQAAYNHAVGNSSLFGNVSVRCYLRDLEDSAAEVPEAAKARGDDSINETPRVKDPVVVRQTSVLAPQTLPQPVVQLKSILKKSSGDESGQVTDNGSSSKGTPRVKFMLGGEENSRGDQLMVGNRNKFNNTTSIADGGAHSPIGMDFNSKEVRKVISQPPFPNVPLSQFAKTPQVNFHNSEMAMAPRNSANFINTSASASASATRVDISQQMISLLNRCNDVVTNLSGLLGYVPYHPL
ncbi:hypothetical protein L6164_035022 [Bauhinia variegata]|uniref:Uncharacterized protein n=1 Tax=Bauhinia variegata TaxID=167791 RepID=A0ACB9KX27_BAUVA|nr:hypothetical protein L6164_035022 [Bauhinia variegata]